MKILNPFEVGDFVRLNFTPQAGHEQGGERPALVVSESGYNRAGMALVCPITTKVKGYPFEVHIPPGLPVKGVVLSDQIKCVDLMERQARALGCKAPKSVLETVRLHLALILGLRP